MLTSTRQENDVTKSRIETSEWRILDNAFETDMMLKASALVIRRTTFFKQLAKPKTISHGLRKDTKRLTMQHKSLITLITLITLINLIILMIQASSRHTKDVLYCCNVSLRLHQMKSEMKESHVHQCPKA